MKKSGQKRGGLQPDCQLDGVVEQCSGGTVQYGAISGMDTLKDNLQMNCIPETIFEMKLDDYEEFLKQRRVSLKLLARE